MVVPTAISQSRIGGSLATSWPSGSSVITSKAAQRCLIEIHFQVVFGLRILDVPVHIHNSGSLLEDFFDLRRQFDLVFVIGPVDFRDKSLEHRRPGRNFRDLDARAEKAWRFCRAADAAAAQFRGSALCGRSGRAGIPGYWLDWIYGAGSNAAPDR